jgi:hypothetical protein
MSYGDFNMQIKDRGATAIERLSVEKTTVFIYEGASWRCVDKNRTLMAGELADGYEMGYCLALYCDTVSR